MTHLARLMILRLFARTGGYRDRLSLANRRLIPAPSQRGAISWHQNQNMERHNMNGYDPQAELIVKVVVNVFLALVVAGVIACLRNAKPRK